MDSRTEDFLKRHSILPECVDIDAICNFKLSEMRAALEGRPSSLAMLQSYCRPVAGIPLNRKVAVIDAGGTNLRTCSVFFDDNSNPVVEDFAATSMPGVSREVSAEQFFSVIADQVERFVPAVDTFGFCFSYAARILPDHDGVPFLMSKEIKAPQVIGKHLGKELFAQLASRGHNMDGKKIIVMNDTVTTLLAGLSRTAGLGCKGCIGFILGTGTNTAFMGKEGIINEESAELSLRLGDIDRRFTESTLDPDAHLLEKMVGGAYLGPLSLFILRTAAEEGLFSRGFSRNLERVLSLSTHEMCDFIADAPSPLDMCVSEDYDAVTLKRILAAFIERAAKISAANLAATVLFTPYGMEEPVLINADGTTFYSTPSLKDNTERYLGKYLAQKGRRAVFTNIRRSPVIGSAIGALSI